MGLGVERTPHDGSDTRDEIDDLGFDAGIGASAERRVVRSGREIDWGIRLDMKFAGLYRLEQGGRISYCARENDLRRGQRRR